MSNLTFEMFITLTSAAKITERSLHKTVRVACSKAEAAAKADARVRLDDEIQNAKSEAKKALRNRVAGQRHSDARYAATLDEAIDGFRRTSKANLANAIEEIRSTADAQFVEVEDLFDAGAFDAFNKAGADAVAHGQAVMSLHKQVFGVEMPAEVIAMLHLETKKPKEGEAPVRRRVPITPEKIEEFKRFYSPLMGVKNGSDVADTGAVEEAEGGVE